MDGACSRLIPIGAERMHARIWDADGPTVMIAHGVTGTSEVPIAISLGVTLGLAVLLLAWAWSCFARGVGIRT